MFSGSGNSSFLLGQKTMFEAYPHIHPYPARDQLRNKFLPRSFMFERNMMPDVVGPSMDATVGFPGPFGCPLWSCHGPIFSFTVSFCGFSPFNLIPFRQSSAWIFHIYPGHFSIFLHISPKFPGHFCPQHGIFWKKHGASWGIHH